MRKFLFLFVSALLLVFVSCENFMNGSDVQDQLAQMIDVANAKSFTIVISNDTTMGSFLSSGDKECKVGYSIDVQFTVKKDSYVYKGLEAVNKNSTSEKLSDYVSFEEISSEQEKNNGVYKYKVTLLKESNNILIQPNCVLIPKVISVKPESNSTSYDQDELVQITFNKALDSTSNQFENFENISIFDSIDDLKEYFDEPYLSNENTVLNLRPKQDVHILRPDSNEKKSITVSVVLTNIKDADGLYLKENLTHTYRISDSFGNQKKSKLLVKEQIIDDISTGSFDKDGEIECTVNYNIDLQFNVKKSSYVFQGLKATHKDGTEFVDSPVEFNVISENEISGIYIIRVLVNEQSDDILIKPVCVPVPKIISMSPEYEYDGVQQDTTICLNFNKPVTSVNELEYLNLSINISDASGQNLAQYFDKPYFSSDSTILYIPTVKKQRMLKNKEDKKDIIVQFDLSGIKDEFGNIGSGSYQNKYRINGTLDNKKPTLSNVSVYSGQDKQNKLLETAFNKWPASSSDKTIYNANHVRSSVYVEMTGYDADSGIARAHVSERLIKYSDGSAPDTIQTLESAVEFLEQSDDNKYCLIYDMKNNMDGIVELTFSIEDYAGNINKDSESKKVYVLKDTLVDSSSICFDQETSQIELTAESWLAAIPDVNGNTQNVKLTMPVNNKDTFYPNCTSDYTIQGFWGYSKDAITNPITIAREKGEYTFTRDVSKFVYIKLIISDEIGNTSEVIKYMDPRPVFNSVLASALQNPQSNVELTLKGLDSIKLLANKKLNGGGGKGGERDNKTYTQFIACIYDSVDAEGNPVGEPTKYMYFTSVWNESTSTNEPYAGGNDLGGWREIRNFTGYENETPLNKLIRLYAVSFCGDFLSPMTSNYVEYMISSLGEYGFPVYAEGKAPRLSNASDSDITFKDVIYEYGPYIKDTVKLKTERVPNAGMYKITIEDYKTNAAIAEGNVQYQFLVYERCPNFNFSSEEEALNANVVVTDDICSAGMNYTYNEAEFYLPAINYYKFYIVASGKEGTYMAIDPEDHDVEPMIGDDPGISFYLNDATTPIKLLGFTEDINPPSAIGAEIYSDPFSQNTEAGSVKIAIAWDDTGLYKNSKNNYELTYYLIPATGTKLQTNKTYTLEELEKNYSRYKRTIEYSVSSDPNASISIPMGNEKGGVYNLVVVYEDVYHNSNIVTYPSVNRLIGDLTFTQTSTEVQIETGNNGTNQGQQGGDPYQQGGGYYDENGQWVEPNQQGSGTENGYYDENGQWIDLSQQGGGSTTIYNCQQLEFTLDENDYVKIYQAGYMGLNHKWEQIWSSNQSEDNIYLAWDSSPQAQTSQNPQGEQLRDAWFKICGYKKTDSAFEMGFYNTKYYYMTDNPGFVTCNSKNAITGLNGIQIFFDNPILAHTMFFKDYIPDDIDRNKPEGWERRGAETGVLYAKPSTQITYQFDSSGNCIGTSRESVPTTATYSFEENYAGIPSGCYYTTIIHFADGDVIMSDIKYKE